MATTIFNQTLTMDDSDRSDASIRQILICAAGGPGTDTHIRVTFKASSTNAFWCDNCSIGIYTNVAPDGETTAAPTSLLFGGLAPMHCAAGGILVSDNLLIAGSSLNAGWTTSDLLMVIMDITGGGVNTFSMHQTGIAGANASILCTGQNTYNKATQAEGFSGANFGARCHGVTLVETLIPSGGGGGGGSNLVFSSLINSPLLNGRLL